MAMAQGYSRNDVQSILDDVAKTELIDEKNRRLLLHAEKITRCSCKLSDNDIKQLRDAGCTDEEIFEATAVASLFNYMDRMARRL